MQELTESVLSIFPSFLKHQVNFKSTKDTRISLAFIES
jgi:hypothetical protein